MPSTMDDPSRDRVLRRLPRDGVFPCLSTRVLSGVSATRHAAPWFRPVGTAS